MAGNLGEDYVDRFEGQQKMDEIQRQMDEAAVGGEDSSGPFQFGFLPAEVRRRLDDIEPFSALHVRGEYGWAIYPAGSEREIWRVSRRNRVRLEIDKWLGILGEAWKRVSEGEPLVGVPRPHSQLGREGLGRTIRMLVALKQLLVESRSEIVRVAEISEDQDDCVKLLNLLLDWNPCPPKSGASENPHDDLPCSLVRMWAPDSYSPGWSIAWPLLIVRAAAWSQTEWAKATLWEAESAMRARQDHVHAGRMNEIELRLLAFLIRFQSAPGQLARGTGNARFLEKAKSVAEQTVKDLAAKQPLNVPDDAHMLRYLLAALGILAHAQDFRYRKIQGSDEPEERQSILDEPSVTQATNFREFWRKTHWSIHMPDLKQASPSERLFTWSYSHRLLRQVEQLMESKEIEPIPEPSSMLEKFIQEAEKLFADERNRTQPVSEQNGNEVQFAGFSFVRDHIDFPPLVKAVWDGILKVAENGNQFRDYFSTELRRIQDPIDPGQHFEEIAVIQLKEHITALHLAYTDQDGDTEFGIQETSTPSWDYCRKLCEDQPSRSRLYRALFEMLPADIKVEEFYARSFGHSPASEQATNRDAWQLFRYLFLVGAARGIINWAGPLPHNYCPTYLIGRLLKIIHHLRPNTCLDLEIEKDGGERDVIHLPILPPGAQSQAPAIKVIARYVCAHVSNIVMGTPTTVLRDDLQSLEERPHGAVWAKAIRAELQANAYFRLLGHYPDDFHHVNQHVQTDGRLQPRAGFLEKTRADPQSELLTLLSSRPDKPVVLLGVDVGGTYIKITFYELFKKNGHPVVRYWNPQAASGSGIPNSLRIATNLENQRYRGVKSFCARLVSEVTRHLTRHGYGTLDDIDAIGISWPGPIRHGRIRGWSGILKNFENERGEPLSSSVGLRELLELDIVGELSKLLRSRGMRDIPVVMVNDGDGHAAGEVAARSLKKQLAPGISQVVLKAGTGTAGAVMINGRILPGLMEFGKLVVNLAYEPRGDYPEGLANLYFSSRTLPMLAVDSLPHLAQLSPALTSLEVGLLAGLIADGHTDGVCIRRLQELILESGVIAFSNRLPKHIDASKVSTLLEPVNWERDGELRHVIESELNCEGARAYEEFRERIRIHGRLRLHAIFQLAPIVSNRANRKDEEDEKDVVAELATILERGETQSLSVKLRHSIVSVARKARCCVEKMGDYAGDLCALLYTIHHMDQVLLSGGVNSGSTGAAILARASSRCKSFSEFTKIPEPMDQILRFRAANVATPPVAQDALPADLDCGPFGAAVTSCFELLLKRQRSGLTKVRQMVQALTFSQQLEVSETLAFIPNDTMTLADFAITSEQLNEYLEENADVLGIIPATIGSHGTKVTRYARHMSHHQ